MKIVSDPKYAKIYWLLLGFNLASSAPCLFVLSGISIWCGAIGLSALTALAETLLVLWAGNRNKLLSDSILAFCIALNIIFLIVDIYLLQTFDMIIGYQALRLTFNSTTAEIAEFAANYLSFRIISKTLAIATLAAGIIWAIACIATRLVRTRVTLIISLTLSALGIVMMLWIVIRYAIVGSYNDDHKCTALSRIAFSISRTFVENARVNKFIDITKSTPAKGSPEFDVILILGESYNRLHSPLYGYDKPTTPNLSAFAADSSLAVYSDVIAPGDWTEEAVKGIFSLSNSADTYFTAPFFPALFKKSGYYTAIYENQYTLGASECLLSNRELSEMSFDFRDDTRTRYDHQLTETIKPSDKNGLYIIHLYGQHYEYNDRYPSEWRYFTAADYDDSKFTASQRTILANYDNATRYNDFVIKGILDKWVHRRAIAIYLSDHGEEVFDCRDYFGHGNSASAPDPMYQLRVPMMIWMSDSFQKHYPLKVTAIHNSANLPVSTNDISHTLLDAANIVTPAFDPTRSLISPAYNASGERKTSFYGASCATVQ